MSLADIVSISISTEAAPVTAAGFGTPLIFGVDCPAGFTERVRYYSTLSELTDDGFSATGPTYLMASAVFAQTPRVTRLAVGRGAATYAQRWAITPTAANSTVYKLTVNGNAISVTSDASATVSEINVLLKAAIDALAITGMTVSDQTTYMRIVMTAGLTAAVSVPNDQLGQIAIVEDTVDVSMAADLAAINTEDSSWYGLLVPFHSNALTMLAAAFAEANSKIFVAQTQDSAVITVSSGSDTGSVAYNARAYARTALIYNPRSDAYADGGFMGRCLPLDPGSETWKFKTLSGVPVSVLTSTQKTNALAKNVNTYTTIAGVNITEDGKVLADEYIDVVRFRDWLEARMAEAVFGALARAKKIPFTDKGISTVEGLVRATLAAGVAAGGLASDPAPVVTVPKAVDVSANDKAARHLPDVKFDAVLAGAIHSVAITGTISV